MGNVERIRANGEGHLTLPPVTGGSLQSPPSSHLQIEMSLKSCVSLAHIPDASVQFLTSWLAKCPNSIYPV